MSTAADTLDPAVSIPDARPDAAAPTAIDTRGRRRRLVLFVVAAILIAIATVRVWPLLVAPPAGDALRASGRIEGREVTLAAKTIQGRVTQLLADEGETVSKGQLLAELDAAQVEAQVAAAAATVSSVDAQVRQARLDVDYAGKNSAATIAAADAALSSAQAHTARANAILSNATITYDRATALFDAGAIPRQDVDAAEMTLHTSRADVAAADKDVLRAEANLALAKASADTIGLKREQLRSLEESRRMALARLAEARANLAERLIVAPENGTVVSRAVEVGDVVSPGSPIFQLVDMDKLYVKVYIPEPDIGKLRLGDAADVSVDAFPGRRFPARLAKIYQQAEFTPKNVETAEERLKLVFGVELAILNADGVLKPGMPADCVIHWQRDGSTAIGHGS